MRIILVLILILIPTQLIYAQPDLIKRGHTQEKIDECIVFYNDTLILFRYGDNDGDMCKSMITDLIWDGFVIGGYSYDVPIESIIVYKWLH